ncbi:MAG: phosphoenolpyruvate--protein phosphotransferase [bacterium]
MSLYLKGIPVSPGWAMAKAIIPISSIFDIKRYHIPPEATSTEINRFLTAIEKSKEEIKEIARKIDPVSGKEALLILDMHTMILEDRSFIENVIGRIKKNYINTEWALTEVLSDIERTFDKIEDEYIKERRFDIAHEGQRILKHLSGQETYYELEEPGIIVLSSFALSNTPYLMKDNIVGLVLETGGLISHPAIIARSLGIPAVAGIKDVTGKINDGQNILVDGDNGILIVEPELEIVGKYEKTRSHKKVLYTQPDRKNITKTLDGTVIRIMANIEFIDEAEDAFNAGAEGIGLVRTEYLYADKRGFPSEETSFMHYSTIAKLFAGYPVTIRLLDIGGDKVFTSYHKRIENPALGLRGIRVCMKEQSVFRTQIRAILRAGTFGDVRILLPMVSSVEEIKEVKQIIEEEKQNLTEKGIATGKTKLGCLIETPAAAMIIDAMSGLVDFVSVGTNDLIQYTIAIDRGDEEVSYLYQPLHPAVLKLLSMIAQQSEACKIPAQVCGEMASVPLYLPILIGMGFTELSMNINIIDRARRFISKIDKQSAQKVLMDIMKLSSAEEIERLITDIYAKELNDEN